MAGSQKVMELPDFSRIFHESSKDLAKGHPLIPADSSEWPDEWKTTYFKKMNTRAEPQDSSSPSTSSGQVF